MSDNTITRINIGSGDIETPGYAPWDIKDGNLAYPLAFPDGSLEEIRASHVLEHFSHRQVQQVIDDWARALRPGGRLRIAVPDFQWLAERYIEASKIPIQQYIMGGHVDDNDHHGCIFDETVLTDCLRKAGLIGISRWTSEIADCAGAEGLSLNIQAHKPPESWPRSAAVMSCPRLGFMDNFFSATAAFTPLGIPLHRYFGAYWEQGMERVMTAQLEDPELRYLIALDYDSVFTRNDVECLLSLMERHPKAGAIAALQVHRLESRPLMTLPNQPESNEVRLERTQLREELLELATAHFGLTIIRADLLRALPRPWFWSQPDPDGAWGPKRTDADIGFWNRWRGDGNTLYLANRVPIGHLELMIRWPDLNMRAIYQAPNDYWERGGPGNLWR